MNQSEEKKKKKKERKRGKKERKQSIKTEQKMAQMLGLADKYFKAAITNIF